VLNLHQELELDRKAVGLLADVVHNVRDVGASIASGSFVSHGMIIAPCSMKTLAAVANGMSDNLITRAADVVLKERRRLVMMVRETPFNLAHLRNMTAVTEMGGIIFPPLPGFYHRPKTIAEMVDHTVGRVLDLFDVEHHLTPRWAGLSIVSERRRSILKLFPINTAGCHHGCAGRCFHCPQCTPRPYCDYLFEALRHNGFFLGA
jgi:4-hydroxy-3-polyprenylbenzoate decarboxylase